jgi:hypothetical protein
LCVYQYKKFVLVISLNPGAKKNSEESSWFSLKTKWVYPAQEGEIFLRVEIVLNLLIMFTDLSCYVVILKDCSRFDNLNYQPPVHVVARRKRTLADLENTELVSSIR